MAEVVGYLNNDQATFGEKEVLKRLEQGLPKEFTVYVECPIGHGDMPRYPDFIIVTNFGVVVIEVKDWVTILEFDKFHVKISQRGGKIRVEDNPVNLARNYATLLNRELQGFPQLVDGWRGKCTVPWGYAVVLPHQPTSLITQMRKVWGEANVLNLEDLEPYLVTQRLKATIPKDSTLNRDELRYIRGVINPVVLVENIGVAHKPGYQKPAIILDEAQERLVTEPPKRLEQLDKTIEPMAEQVDLFETLIPDASPGEDEKEKPKSIEDLLSKNVAIRLVRGFAGSGKSLVLMQRARYLAAQHRDWKLLVLTYNEKPAKKLAASFIGSRNIKATNFHKLCLQLLGEAYKGKVIDSPEGWVERYRTDFPIVRELGSKFIGTEIEWILEMDLQSLELYLQADRKGRGSEKRLTRTEREKIYGVYQAYQRHLREQNQYDWAEVPYLVQDAFENADVQPPCYDAILIDEAQDFAPSWLSVVKRMLNPNGGLLFLADDPMQSIYRYYSWREKGVPVVGRTRWLRIPYRNTREIYQAAYEVIRQDEALKQSLENELGMTVEPELETLRHGPRPRLYRFDHFEQEATFIRGEVERLIRNGYRESDIVVLHRRKNGVKRLQGALRGMGVDIGTFHALKGMEYDHVFLSQMQEAFHDQQTEEEISQERRLVYMCMTRSRSHLYLSYEGVWPRELKEVLEHIDRVI